MCRIERTSVAPAVRRAAPRVRAMSLSEVMVSMALAAMLVGATLTAMVFMARTGVGLANYQSVEREGQLALDLLGRDIRTASAVATTTTSITLTTSHPDYASYGGQVTYAYDPAISGATARCFYVMPGSSAATNAKTILVRNVTAFSFTRFRADDTTATTDAATKKLRINLTVTRTTAGAAAATGNLISASYVLRNS